MAATRKKELRHGYTTGACAAAAAKGAALMLRDQRLVEAVEIDLPAGFSATFLLHGQSFSPLAATCHVIKDAGDDPDVTNGCEVWAEVTIGSAGDDERPPRPAGTPPVTQGGQTLPRPPCAVGGGGGVTITGGTGIGRVTKPGLAVGVGEWAINPVPRRMITAAVQEVCAQRPLHVTLSIPDGKERARRTLNARLGILGGLSILGTSGVVKPISTRAWTDTLDAALDVAVACGCRQVVLSTGRTSEVVAQGELKNLPEEAYIMMGDHVGYALRACAARPLAEVILCGQFAKLLKIACGHEQTHVSSSQLDLNRLADWLAEAGFPAAVVRHCRRANTAREVLEHSNNDPALISLVCDRARSAATVATPALRIKVLLAGYDGGVLYFR